MSTVRLNLYFPEGSEHLYDKIKHLAKKDMRSMNLECIALLAQIVEHRREDWEDMEQEKTDK